MKRDNASEVISSWAMISSRNASNVFMNETREKGALLKMKYKKCPLKAGIRYSSQRPELEVVT